MSIMSYNVEAIGYLRLERPSKKYQLPRQPESSEPACIELLPGKNFEQALEGLEQFSHLWILFWMHEVTGYKPKVRAPGIEKKLGLFATRSPHRPNPIGLSCVKLIKVESRKIWIEGADILDGTPILDVKPYLAHKEAFSQAKMGWIEKRIEAKIEWETGLYQKLELLAVEDPYLNPLALERRLRLDPLPSYYNRLKIDGNQFEMASGRWRFKGTFHFNEEKIPFFLIQSVVSA